MYRATSPPLDDHRHAPRLRVVGPELAEDVFCPASDHAKRGAELVRDAGGEHPHGGELLGAQELALERAHLAEDLLGLLVQVLQLGGVARPSAQGRRASGGEVDEDHQTEEAPREHPSDQRPSEHRGPPLGAKRRGRAEGRQRPVLPTRDPDGSKGGDQRVSDRRDLLDRGGATPAAAYLAEERMQPRRSIKPALVDQVQERRARGQHGMTGRIEHEQVRSGLRAERPERVEERLRVDQDRDRDREGRARGLRGQRCREDPEPAPWIARDPP
jgi:hypothetical protein